MDQYMALASMTAEMSSYVINFDSGVFYSTERRCFFIAQTVTTKRRASVNLVYNNKALHVRVRGTPNRTKQNLIVRMVNLQAGVTNDKRLRSTYTVQIQADTKHRAASL